MLRDRARSTLTSFDLPRGPLGARPQRQLQVQQQLPSGTLGSQAGRNSASARVIPLRLKAERRLPQPVRKTELANAPAPPQQSADQGAALRQAVAFARAVMAEADRNGDINYYDRWGNKVCLKR